MKLCNPFNKETDDASTKSTRAVMHGKYNERRCQAGNLDARSEIVSPFVLDMELLQRQGPGTEIYGILQGW